jgi:MFS family permease
VTRSVEHRTAIGAVMAIDNVLLLLLVPWAGPVSDRATARGRGRLPLVLTGFVLSSIGMALLPASAALGLAVLIAALILLHTGINLQRSPFQALVVDLVPSRYRSLATGSVTFQMCVGAIVFLMLGRMLGMRPAFLIAAGTVLGIAAAFALGVSEPRVSDSSSAEVTFRSLADAAWSAIRGVVPGMRPVFLASLLLQLTFQTFTTWYALHATERFGVRPEDATIGFIAWAMGGVLGALPAGFIGTRIGRRNAMLVGFGIMAVTLAALDRVTTINAGGATPRAGFGELDVPDGERVPAVRRARSARASRRSRVAVPALQRARRRRWRPDERAHLRYPEWLSRDVHRHGVLHGLSIRGSPVRPARRGRGRYRPGCHAEYAMMCCRFTLVIPLSVLDLAPIVEGGDAATSFRNSLDLARHAERLGYRRFWLAEHHNIPSVASAATSVLIAHVAGGTSTIRVGAGGIMLPNHSPLVIAEQFGTLASLFPGRIDLGLGRAPGSDQVTARALRRSPEAADSFPQDVLELMAYFRPAEPEQGVRAILVQDSMCPSGSSARAYSAHSSQPRSGCRLRSRRTSHQRCSSRRWTCTAPGFSRRSNWNAHTRCSA